MKGPMGVPEGLSSWCLDPRPDPRWEFPKIGVPYFGVLIIRILLFRVLYLFGSPIFGNSQIKDLR